MTSCKHKDIAPVSPSVIRTNFEIEDKKIMIIVPKIMEIFEVVNLGGTPCIYTHRFMGDRFNKFINLLVDLYIDYSMLNNTIEDEYYSESY